MLQFSVICPQHKFNEWMPTPSRNGNPCIKTNMSSQKAVNEVVQSRKLNCHYNFCEIINVQFYVDLFRSSEGRQADGMVMRQSAEL
jgi:hypothetical protein